MKTPQRHPLIVNFKEILLNIIQIPSEYLHVQSRQKKHQKKLSNMLKVNNKWHQSEIVLVPLMLPLNILRIFF